MKINSVSNQSFGSTFRVNLGRKISKNEYRLGTSKEIDEFISKVDNEIRGNNDVSVYREDADKKGKLHYYFINITDNKKDKKVLDLAKKLGIKCDIVSRYEIDKRTDNILINMGESYGNEMSKLLQVITKKLDK